MDESENRVQRFSSEVSQFLQAFEKFEKGIAKASKGLDPDVLLKLGDTLRKLGEQYYDLASQEREGLTAESSKSLNRELTNVDKRLQGLMSTVLPKVSGDAFGVPLQSFMPASRAQAVRMKVEDLHREIESNGELNQEQKREYGKVMGGLRGELELVEKELEGRSKRADEHQISRGKISLAEVEAKIESEQSKMA